jgi:hypothetical protein
MVHVTAKNAINSPHMELPIFKKPSTIKWLQNLVIFGTGIAEFNLQKPRIQNNMDGEVP